MLNAAVETRHRLIGNGNYIDVALGGFTLMLDIL